ncbi:chaplin family protein [Streptomyces naganishii]|uniref:chaplin family protein n=1 Tax=Streptomyces naganishii TaxID=285447 RepID=UPI001E5983B3|nr:chaplin family protein [Streptomyces naganishii]
MNPAGPGNPLARPARITGVRTNTEEDNTVNVIGALNPAFGNACVNTGTRDAM